MEVFMLLFTLPECDENTEGCEVLDEVSKNTDAADCPDEELCADAEAEEHEAEAVESDAEAEENEEEVIEPYVTSNDRLIGLSKENIIELTYIDTDTVYENKHVMLFDYFRISEQLTMKNCFIEICGGGFIGDSGRLILTDCEIVNPLGKLISGRFYECKAENCKFIFHNYYPGPKVINCDDELLFEGCHFVNHNPKYSKTKAEFEIPPFINAPEATFSSCDFKDFTSFTEIRAGHFNSCRFDRCCEVTAIENAVSCSFNGAECVLIGEKAEKCEFTACLSIISDGELKDCSFIDLEAKNDEPVITVKGKDVTDCRFVNIIGSGVLAKLLGGYIKGAKFEGCDGEAVKKMTVGEKKGGFLGLKKVGYEPFVEG